MATGITNNYPVTTPPFSTERHLGSLATIISRQFRFCMLQPFADVEIECGVFVTMTTNAVKTNLAKHLSTATDKIFGVTYYNTQRLMSWDNTLKAFKYKKDDLVSLIEEGDVYMYAEKAVDVGDPVYTRYSADTGLTRVGALSNAAGTGLLAVSGAKFLETLSAPGIVAVSLPDII